MKLSDIKYGEHLKIPRKAFYMQVDSLGNEYCKNFSSNLKKPQRVEKLTLKPSHIPEKNKSIL